MDNKKDASAATVHKSSKSSEYRRKRINRIKAAIVVIVIIFFILPTIFCIFLGVQVCRLQKQMKELINLHSEYGLTYETTGNIDYAYAAEKPSETGVDGSKADTSSNAWGQTDLSKLLDGQIDISRTYTDLADINESNLTPEQINFIAGQSDIIPGSLQINTNITDANITDINTPDFNTTNNNTTDINTADINTTYTNTEDINTPDFNTANINTTNINTTDINPTDINKIDINPSDINTTDINTIDINVIDDDATGIKVAENSLTGANSNTAIDSGGIGSIYAGKKVYLTFDDGPSMYTDDILDILAEYDVKATFFVTGKTDDISKKLYRRIVKEGHTLGMHSYSHKYKKIYNSVEDFDKDFTKLWNLLYDTTGYKPSIYRFPGGSNNMVNKNGMEDFIGYLNDKSIKYFDWNVVSGDATGVEYTKDQLIDNVLNTVALKKKSIVLMHDSQTKETTVESLPGLLEKLISGGAQIVPLDMDVSPIQMIRADSIK